MRNQFVFLYYIIYSENSPISCVRIRFRIHVRLYLLNLSQDIAAQERSLKMSIQLIGFLISMIKGDYVYRLNVNINVSMFVRTKKKKYGKTVKIEGNEDWKRAKRLMATHVPEILEVFKYLKEG